MFFTEGIFLVVVIISNVLQSQRNVRDEGSHQEFCRVKYFRGFGGYFYRIHRCQHFHLTLGQFLWQPSLPREVYTNGSLPKLDYCGKSKQGYYLVSNFLIPGSNLLRFKLDLGKLIPPEQMSFGTRYQFAEVPFEPQQIATWYQRI